MNASASHLCARPLPDRNAECRLPPSPMSLSRLPRLLRSAPAPWRAATARSFSGYVREHSLAGLTEEQAEVSTRLVWTR